MNTYSHMIFSMLSHVCQCPSFLLTPLVQKHVFLRRMKLEHGRERNKNRKRKMSRSYLHYYLYVGAGQHLQTPINAPFRLVGLRHLPCVLHRLTPGPTTTCWRAGLSGYMLNGCMVVGKRFQWLVHTSGMRSFCSRQRTNWEELLPDGSWSLMCCRGG